MNTPDLIKAALALTIVLALAWGVARALRGARLASGKSHRLQVEESLALDLKRRLVLVRCDGRDLLLLVGGTDDLFIGWLEAPP